jgi:hypothetical protein
MTLSYLHPYDFRLHAPVATIHTGDLNVAVSRLSEVYARQQVSVSVKEKQLFVTLVDAVQTK